MAICKKWEYKLLWFVFEREMKVVKFFCEIILFAMKNIALLIYGEILNPIL